MWKLALIAAALCLSASPLDAAAKDGKRIDKTQRREELRRDVERISKEIYRPRDERSRRRR